MRTPRRTIAVTTALYLTVAAAGCSDDAPPATTMAATTAPFPAIEPSGPAVTSTAADGLLLVAQPQSGPGNRVIINRANIGDEPGFIAIYRDGNGAPGGLLGSSELLQGGEHRNVGIRLDRPLAEDASIWAVIHRDDNANGTFDYPEADRPPDRGSGSTAVQFTFTIQPD